RLSAADLPLHQGALAAAERGTRTGGDARNRASLEARVTVGDGVSAERQALCYDPQTSGGLLAAVPPADAALLAGEGWSVIGEVADGTAGVTLS
ncbi:MAG: selenide, water dikinase SelD, partial [Acidimicrobiales bacterium]